MTARRVTLHELQQLGTADLPWDLYDAHGHLIFVQGQRLPTSCNLPRLLHYGLFQHPPASSSQNSPNKPNSATSDLSTSQGAPAQTVSILRQLNRQNARLEKLLPNLGSKLDVETELGQITQHLLQLLAIDTDVALACIFLNQIGGSYAVRHCLETAIIALLLAQGQACSQQQLSTIGKVCLTMNVGMLDLHQQLHNRRSLLTAEEMRSIQRHPEQSTIVLRQAGIEDEDWLNGVLYHHENDDGSGYPYGISHADIPAVARLTSLADRYCAQVSARNYRKSVTPDVAARSLGLDQPSTNAMHQVFMAEIGLFPPGTFVQLQNGEVAVIAARQPHNSPPAYALISSSGVPLLPHPELRDTAQSPYQIVRALHEDEADIRFGMKQIWGAHASL